jgi:hypothetical protein
MSTRLSIVVQTIAHERQRYPTAGDWQFFSGDARLASGDHLVVSVSNVENWKHEALLGVHELIEALGCKSAGISTDAVDAFDIAYEQARTKGIAAPCGCALQDEPGDDTHAPYHAQHVAATAVEMKLATLLNVDWLVYSDAVDALYEKERE